MTPDQRAAVRLKEIREKRENKCMLKLKGLTSFLYTKFVWSGLIRATFLANQNFTIAIFLNLRKISQKNVSLFISSFLTVVGLCIMAIQFFLYSNLAAKAQRQIQQEQTLDAEPITPEQESQNSRLAIFKLLRSDFLRRNFLLFLFIVRPTLLSMSVCLFYETPVISCSVLMIVGAAEFVLTAMRPFQVSILNLSKMFDAVCNLITSVYPMLCLFKAFSEEKLHDLGYVLISFIILMIFMSFVFKLLIAKTVQKDYAKI